MPRRTFTLLLLVFALTHAAAEEIPGRHAYVGLFGGPTICVPVTAAPGNPALPHFGIGVGGGAELSFGRVIAARLGADMLWIGPSSVSAEGILYRAWEGLRLSLEAGYAFQIGELSLRASAGASLTAASYRKTSLVLAYPSILVRAELDVPIGARDSIRIGIPLELMLRGVYTDFSPGLSASFSWSFPIGAER